jgi:hypothetical protein
LVTTEEKCRKKTLISMLVTGTLCDVNVMEETPNTISGHIPKNE